MRTRPRRDREDAADGWGGPQPRKPAGLDGVAGSHHLERRRPAPSGDRGAVDRGRRRREPGRRRWPHTACACPPTRAACHGSVAGTRGRARVRPALRGQQQRTYCEPRARQG
ncbi:hypothetical protein G6F64_015133 [Rhizopus arrhizus]|uniref:Uncharacterized protein n=1 Tax=Rhizopus oryzae TaxID=64495 RepID=A0A9P6WSV4_RHIOR|nr:hypothetical protein G6F24_017661 [Rhizopus arrhizus]KAG1274435.1 hypothetical protein G6F64_015133 [Rhizopus arrhizus]